jgi:predicted Zn-dependent protease
MTSPFRSSVALAALAAGCATQPGQPVWTGWPADANTKAVSSLVESARVDASAGRLGNAAASMERAIRLSPRDARLWQELARLRMKQGQYGQAENVALRSNALMRGDAALRLQNWQIIADSREARGDSEGARSARELAKRIDH